MTFDVAKRLKNSIGNKTVIDGIEYDVWITPELEEDFMRFWKESNEKYTVDEKAAIYASNDEYLVRAIASNETDLIFQLLHSYKDSNLEIHK